MSLRKSKQCPHMSVVMSCNMYICTYVIHISGWWFQKLFISHNIWGNPSQRLIFFKLGWNHQPVYIYPIVISISHCYSILPLWHFQAGRRLQEPMLKSRAMQRHQHHRRPPDGRCMSGTVLWSRGVHGKQIESISWFPSKINESMIRSFFFAGLMSCVQGMPSQFSHCSYHCNQTQLLSVSMII
jgi:hypothetical protein